MEKGKTKQKPWLMFENKLEKKESMIKSSSSDDFGQSLGREFTREIRIKYKLNSTVLIFKIVVIEAYTVTIFLKVADLRK